MLLSSSSFGPVDLDFRPAESRGLLWFSLQECPGCGLVAPRLRGDNIGDRIRASLLRMARWFAPGLRINRRGYEVLSEPGYLLLLQDSTIPVLARRLLCRAYILKAADQIVGAFQQTLAAAWVVDDSQRELRPLSPESWVVEEARKYSLARRLRLEAAALVEGRPNLATDIRLQLLDMLRRAGEWDAAWALAETMYAEAVVDWVSEIVGMQVALICRKDKGAYTVDGKKRPFPPFP
jgi:hypothetical protein